MFKQIIKLIISFFIFLPGCKETVTSSNKGTIILLHGISSAGKTTVARELQDQLKDYYLYMGIDEFTGMMPKRLIGINPEFKTTIEATQQGVTLVPKIINGNQIIAVKTGAYSQKGGMLLPKIFSLYAANGLNLITDFAFSGIDQQLAEEFLKTFVKELQPYKVYFINLTVSPEIAVQREEKRGGFKGLAAGQEFFMLKNLTYPDAFDLEIDTSNFTPKQIAQKIIEFIHEHPNPQAFARLYKTYFN